MPFSASFCRSVLVTGANGYIGRLTVEGLAANPGLLRTIVASDLAAPPEAERLAGVTYEPADIRSTRIGEIIRDYHVECVVHLAAVIPRPKGDRKLEREIDVGGAENVLKACLAHGVKKVIVTSSGAAYGYHADNPAWLDEEHPLRGNQEFPYSDHKRQVEEMLARWRAEHPELAQLIFRPGTILGRRANNPITNLFEQKSITGVTGSDSPFVIIWDMDVAACLQLGVHTDTTGVYNLAGDGVLTLPEMAAMMGKPYKPLPVWLVTAALWVAKLFGIGQYGPEQVNFLRYRPVLANRRLKEEFGYTPKMTSREVFEFYLEVKGYAQKA